MTNSLAREYGVDRIRVNAIAPGAVITQRQLDLWHSKADVEAWVRLGLRLPEDDTTRCDRG